jgi:hypothetical protein
MTSDPELKFLLDNFDEYKKIQASQGVPIISPISTRKSIKSPVQQYIQGEATVSNGRIRKQETQSTSFFDLIPKSPEYSNKHIDSPYQQQQQNNNSYQNGFQQNNNSYQNGFQQPPNNNLYQNGFQQPPNNNSYQNGF